MSDETTLLPCPFCGKPIEVFNAPWADGEPGWTYWHVDEMQAAEDKCPLTTACYDTKKELIEAWNTRATDALADYYRWKSAKGLTPEQHTQWNMELHRLLDGERQRIADLEQLVRDMYDVAARGEFDVGEESRFSERMAKLGVVSEC